MIFSDATSAAYRRTGSLAYWLTGALVLLPGCQEERRVPYIPPTLHNWQQPYRGQKGLRLHVFHVGTLRPRGGILTRPGDTTPAPERAVVAYVLQHPQHGLIVLNTGLSHHLAEDAEDYLGRLQAMLLDVELETGQDLPSQMRAAKMEPKAVRWVVLSNLQFPHTGEAEGFPEAVRVVSRAEYEHAKGGGAGYIAREFDDISNWQLVDFSDGHPLGTMPAAIDLFEDGSVMLLDAQGPTEGNLAILVRLPSRPVILAGDLAPQSTTLRYVAVPSGIRDLDAWWDRIWRLKRFRDLDAVLLVVPGNDPTPLSSAMLPEIHDHDFTASDAEPPATPAIAKQPQPARQ